MPEVKQRPGERLAALKHDAIRNKLTRAYEAYLNDPVNDSQIYLAVIEFALTKLRGVEFELREVDASKTIDDWAQEAAIAVWQGLSGFKGNATNFYAWVHAIVYNHRQDYKGDLIDTKRNRIGLTVTEVGDDGEEDVRDNPQLFANALPPEAGFVIPSYVTGTDRNICEFLEVRVPREPTEENKAPYRGLTWDEIGRQLNMTGESVRKRVERMRAKYGNKKGPTSEPSKVQAEKVTA